MSSYRPVRAAASRIACGTSKIGPLSLGIFDHSLEEPDDVMRRLLGVAGAVACCRVRHGSRPMTKASSFVLVPPEGVIRHSIQSWLINWSDQISKLQWNFERLTRGFVGKLLAAVQDSRLFRSSITATSLSGKFYGRTNWPPADWEIPS